MANKNDIKQYGDNRARITEMLDKGYRVPEMARILPISRQRIHILAKAVGGEDYTSSVYPRMKPCQTITEGESHYFMAYRYTEDRCPVHRRHSQSCDQCGNQYSTSGRTTTCSKCKKNAYARRRYSMAKGVKQ